MKSTVWHTCTLVQAPPELPNLLSRLDKFWAASLCYRSRLYPHQSMPVQSLLADGSFWGRLVREERRTLSRGEEWTAPVQMKRTGARFPSTGELLWQTWSCPVCVLHRLLGLDSGIPLEQFFHSATLVHCQLKRNRLFKIPSRNLQKEAHIYCVSCNNHIRSYCLQHTSTVKPKNVN